MKWGDGLGFKGTTAKCTEWSLRHSGTQHKEKKEEDDLLAPQVVAPSNEDAWRQSPPHTPHMHATVLG